jgi:hypothetical protein
VIHGILEEEILHMPMRKLCLLLLASLLLVPAAAFADRVGSNGGSLVVSDAVGKLTVSGHGLIFGHVDRGTITVIGDYRPDDNTALPSVSGAKLKFAGGNVVYSGSDVRFLFPGGRYTLVVDGSGIDLSAVGTGKLSAVGRGSAEDGWVTIDGGAPQSLDLIDVVSYGRSAGALGLTKGKSG